MNNSCQKCWDDAHLRAAEGGTKTQTDHYIDLLRERRSIPCTPEEQDRHDAELKEILEGIDRWEEEVLKPLMGDMK